MKPGDIPRLLRGRVPRVPSLVPQLTTGYSEYVMSLP